PRQAAASSLFRPLPKVPGDVYSREGSGSIRRRRIAGTRDLELSPDMFLEARNELVDVVVQLARPEPAGKLRCGRVRVLELLPKQIVEEGQVVPGGRRPGPDLAGDDRADVCRHQHLEPLLP